MRRVPHTGFTMLAAISPIIVNHGVFVPTAHGLLYVLFCMLDICRF